MCMQHESGDCGAQINFSTLTELFRTDCLHRIQIKYHFSPLLQEEVFWIGLAKITTLFLLRTVCVTLK